MKLTISRYNPETDQAPQFCEYEVPDQDRSTVLQALIYVYDHLDSTLSFGYNCRYKKCGLCAMMVNGRARMACLTPLQDGMVLEPLRGLPVLRDLLIDRRPLFAALGDLAAYIPEPTEPERPQVIHEPPERRALTACSECLSCLSACPHYRQDSQAFGGPFLFVKLAQLHLDPRDLTDRQAQARQLGIETCVDCRGCPCPSGVPIRRGAVAALLGAPAV